MQGFGERNLCTYHVGVDVIDSAVANLQGFPKLTKKIL